MRKVARNFVCPPKNAIFAVQKREKGGYLYPYLPYCMTADSFDLAKSGKFNIRCQNEFSQASLVSSRRTRTAYYICDTRCFPEPCQADVGEVGT